MGKPTYEEHLSMLKTHAPDEFLKIQMDENHNEHRRLEILDKTRSLVENIRSMVGKIDKEDGDALVLGKMTDESIKQTILEVKRRLPVYGDTITHSGKTVRDLLEIIEHLQSSLDEARNGKNIGQLHHQIVSLEVRNMAQTIEIETLTKERGDARNEAKAWRHKSFGEPSSKRIIEAMIEENPLPWETK